MARKIVISSVYAKKNDATLATDDCLRFLQSLPDECAQLVLTSPPYNIGKSYETRSTIDEYLAFQTKVITEAVRITKPGGSLCWQLGHYINGHAQIIPLDVLLYPAFAAHQKHGVYLRNRIIWHFEHGCHSHQRLSGRHEVVLWFTKSDNYTFHLDRIRVPQKYPGKRAYRGPKKGQFSGNPLGKNPGDVWTFPNVKGKHVEKTIHPCQFPLELAERLIEALTDKGDLVVDPFAGVGTTVVSAVQRGRKGAGCDVVAEYMRIARKRVRQIQDGTLRFRPRDRPVYKPPPNTSLTRVPPEFAYVLPLELAGENGTLVKTHLNGHPRALTLVNRNVTSKR